MNFLPVTLSELNSRGVDRPDFVLVTGDAYVDHPSFGAAVISRVLDDKGYSVGIIAQPDWKKIDSFKIFGEPRLGFLVTGGNIDSMVNHYSVAKKPRNKDCYTPNGATGARPDRATIVYCNKIREAYKTAPIIIGGLEASLRRLSHYDYWDNTVRRSILLDSSADLLVYGMGESQILQIAKSLSDGVSASQINFVKGTVYKTKLISDVGEHILLPSFKEVAASKEAYAKSFSIQFANTDSHSGKALVESYGSIYVCLNPPAPPLSKEQFDHVYSLPYTRTYHPMYDKIAKTPSTPENPVIPAIAEVKFSIISSRGCFGGCSFCALSFHQGRVVQARSHESIITEAREITESPDFKGYIHDVGGPTANFRSPACSKQRAHGACADKQCLYPKPCKNLDVSHSDYLQLLRKLRKLPKVKKVFIRSGIRFDYLMADGNQEFFKELVKYHISGQLKIAPEHISQRVLAKMQKPERQVYDKFVKRYNELNKEYGMKQFLVPYFISSHPGSELADAIELAEYLRDTSVMPEQVQDFYPTPGTLSTCMYYTEFDPRTNTSVYVPKSPHDKAMQRALMQYQLPQNYELVKEALHKAGREDLIGFGSKCLIRPRQLGNKTTTGGNKKNPTMQASKPPEKKKKTIRNVHKKARLK